MPVYEYQCINGHTFSTDQKITEDALTKCQECGESCKRLLFPSAFALKGGGWSGDGYAKKGK